MAAMNRLAPSRAAKLTAPGRHGDGGGLYLHIDPPREGRAPAKRWVFVYHFGVSPRGKKPRREMGLGSFSTVSLAAARDAAATARQAVAEGRDPRAVPVQETPLSFGEVADRLVDDIRAQWRGKKTEARWRLAVGSYAAPFRDKLWFEVTTDDVLRVLKPAWSKTPEMAQKVREAWERVFDATKARLGAPAGWENPARWTGHLKLLLPRPRKLTRGHHRALSPDDVPAFAAALRAHDGMGKCALAFTLLTGVRTSTTLDAIWGEIDLEAATWSIPVARLKNAEDLAHAGFAYFVVPLSPQAIGILERARTIGGGVASAAQPVFAGGGSTGKLSTNTMRALLIRMAFSDTELLTVHGFRTTLRVWGGAQMATTTDGFEVRRFSDDALEFAIGHVVGSATQRAYNRSDYLSERTALMTLWGRYVGDVAGAG